MKSLSWLAFAQQKMIRFLHSTTLNERFGLAKHLLQPDPSPMLRAGAG
jgi:hypothetical protein